MYSREEFKNKLQEMLIDLFPDKEISFTTVTIGDEQQEGFRLDKKGNDVSPIILLNSCYEMYEECGDFNRVYTLIKTVIQKNACSLKTLEYFHLHFFDALSINLFDASIRPEAVKGITKPFGDLLQSLVLVHKSSECILERLILTEENLNHFKNYFGSATLEDLWALAKKNVEEYTYKFAAVSKILEINNREDLHFENEKEKDCDAEHYIKFKTSDLQTEKKQLELKDYIRKTDSNFTELYVVKIAGIKNATAILLNKKLLTGIGTAFNSSFYILPANNDELVILADYDADDEEMIKQVIWDANRNVVSENDVFTDELFYYDLQYEDIEFLGRYKQLTVSE